MQGIIEEMGQHVKLVVEYQTLIARCAPQSQAAHELKMLMVSMMTWMKDAKAKDAGLADMWLGLSLCLDDETRAFELARQTLNPNRDLWMHMENGAYMERLAALE